MNEFNFYIDADWSDGCQVVVATEHLLIMGIRGFPYHVLDSTRLDSERCSLSALRAMAGNGMHASAVGTVLFFALGAHEWL